MLSLSANETAGSVVQGDEIYIVDDDPSVRDSLSLLFSQAGYQVTSFHDGPSFVAAARARKPAGVILDIVMPGGSGLDVLKEIDAPHFGAPIFVASARGDIPTAVEAMRRGAFDFFEKRFDAETVVARMGVAIKSCSNGSHNGSGSEAEPRSFPGRKLLTVREHAVLERIVSGASNQETADELGISRRTVEVHRAHILAKLNAKNAADLVRIVLNHGRAYS